MKVGKNEEVERNKNIIKEFNKKYQPSFHKEKMYDELGKKYDLSRTSVYSILIKSGALERIDYEIRDKKIRTEYDKLFQERPNQKKNIIMAELAVKHNVTVGHIYYIINYKN